VNEGAEAYAAIGTEKSKGTKLVSVSGHVNKPGNYEVPLGTPTSELIDKYAGGIRNGNKLKAFIPGGSSVPMLPASKADTPYDYESIQAAGSMLGSGALIVMDDTTNVVVETLRLAHFYMHESCGKCTPCREGTRWMHQILTDIDAGRGKPEQVQLLQDICDNMSFKCFCPLGDAAVGPVASSIEFFPEDYEALIQSMKTAAPVA
jgi:NADH-quinone oxidoreductase subunit F